MAQKILLLHIYMHKDIEGEREDIKHMDKILKIGESGQRVYSSSLYFAVFLYVWNYFKWKKIEVIIILLGQKQGTEFGQ